MKKHLLLLLCLAVGTVANAQFPYSFSVQTDTYVPLTSGTSLNGTMVWDDEDYDVPIGFDFVLDGDTINIFSVIFSQMWLGDPYASDTVSGFVLTHADLIDRGDPDATGMGISQSPIRYQLTGTAPDRIFKYEVYNAGFYDEFPTYGTSNDSMSFQVWLYEGSNVVELRYGGSQVTHPNDYFIDPTGVFLTGFLKEVDFSTGEGGMFYYLKGSPATPVIDSTANVDTLTQGLSGVPQNGTVYRFAPKPVSVKDMNILANMQVYPTATSNYLNVNSSERSELQYTIQAINGATALPAGTLHTGHNRIDVSALPAGTYLLRMTGANGAGVVRFSRL